MDDAKPMTERERLSRIPNPCEFERCMSIGQVQVRWRHVTGNPTAWYCREHFEAIGEDAVEALGGGSKGHD